MLVNNTQRLHLFQQLTKTYEYSRDQEDFINSLIPLNAIDWDGNLTLTCRPRGFVTRRNDLKTYIRRELDKIQQPNCIYCGLHESIVGRLQRDHVAPKDRYSDFLFEPENLALACAACNGFFKKNNFDTVISIGKTYKRSRFSIIHPYYDDYKNHYDISLAGVTLIIKHKKGSRKGKTTIDLFKLNENRQAQLRAGILMQNHIAIDDTLQYLLEAAIKKDYYQ